MIQIKYFFQFDDDNIVAKKIEFCNNHEKNLDMLYELAKENVEKKRRIDLEQFIIICGYNVVTGIKKNRMVEAIQKNLLDKFFKSKYHTFLKEIKRVSIEVIIDNIPKKNLVFHLHE